MKKIIIILLIISLFGVNAYADNDSENEADRFDYKDYLPEKISEILKDSGFSGSADIPPSELIKTLLEYFLFAISKHKSVLEKLFLATLVISIIKRFTDNMPQKTIISFSFTLVFGVSLLDIFVPLFNNTEEFFLSLRELLALMLPSFTAVNIMGGGAISGTTGAASFAAVISLLEALISVFAGGIIVILTVITLLEGLSPSLAEMNLSATIKKHTVFLISLITTVMLTVISFQNIISARADSVSGRTVKFAAAGFIPIIGNAVGEALRTVSSGVAYLKATLGASCALALFVSAAPMLLEVAAIKLMLWLLSLFGNACGCREETKPLTTCGNILDIALSFIICAVVLSFVLVYLFSAITFM